MKINLPPLQLKFLCIWEKVEILEHSPRDTEGVEDHSTIKQNRHTVRQKKEEMQKQAYRDLEMISMSGVPTQSISCLSDSTRFYYHEYVGRNSGESAGKKYKCIYFYFSKGKFCGFCWIFFLFFYFLRLAYTCMHSCELHLLADRHCLFFKL